MFHLCERKENWIKASHNGLDDCARSDLRRKMRMKKFLGRFIAPMKVEDCNKEVIR